MTRPLIKSEIIKALRADENSSYLHDNPNFSDVLEYVADFMIDYCGKNEPRGDSDNH